MRILLVDDDEQLMDILADQLIAQRYAIDVANTGEIGREFVRLFNYDLVVLDLVLPDINGIDLCRQLRTEGFKMPIMLLSACDRHSDKVKGLDAGADDYVVKPFNFEELTARIRALLRRDIQESDPKLHWQELSLDPKNHEVKFADQPLQLTPKEYALIELFMRHPQQVFSPSAIIDNLWSGEDPPGEEAVRTHIKGLRQKLKKAGLAKDTIQTVYGVGYRLKLPVENTPSTITKSKDPSQEINTQIQEQEIAKLWLKFKDTAFQRVAILESFTTAINQKIATQELHTEAKSAAHKLAGSLGGFGFAEGSKIAKKIEEILTIDLVTKIKVAQVQELTISLNQTLQQQPFNNNHQTNLKTKINSSNQALNAINGLVLIIYKEPEPNYAQSIVLTANQQEIKTITANNIQQAQKIIDQDLPSAILFDLTNPNNQDLAFLEEIACKHPHLRIAIITRDIKLSKRLEIFNQGTNIILNDPLEATTAVSTLQRLIQTKVPLNKILIVDDDPQVLLSLELSLYPWCFQVVTLKDPTQLEKTLATFAPDLLILDIEMPSINGLELCQQLRSDNHWQNLPIMFLSVHQDKKTQDRAFEIGANDYICKPIVGSELANLILNRLKKQSN